MKRVTVSFPVVDEILGSYSAALGSDLAGYRNHIYRSLNYYRVLADVDQVPEPVLVAAAFHDIGIWTDRTFDYLAPSVRQAQVFLEARGLERLEPEVRALIEQHHKVRTYSHSHAATVEPYRRADLVDLSLGCVRFGVSREYVRGVKAQLPNAGFHSRLAKVAVRHVMHAPLRPFPMLRW